ncbi:hypothetical protein [Streptomyces sp. XD-27]|uniref:hypothetical protein n=1 Tax=Streptomyces sp. XD-27 TaxID=3062779 RepID=UPI0026F422E7|nr:hypothetical protein [Streptomyces sp. XD-27]WKX73853.1 hypothetical protein Q3Y56_31825 [Streptomyces sp. XD-27]
MGTRQDLLKGSRPHRHAVYNGPTDTDMRPTPSASPRLSLDDWRNASNTPLAEHLEHNCCAGGVSIGMKTGAKDLSVLVGG